MQKMQNFISCFILDVTQAKKLAYDLNRSVEAEAGTIFIYCATGTRAAQAAEMMVEGDEANSHLVAPDLAGHGTIWTVAIDMDVEDFLSRLDGGSE